MIVSDGAGQFAVGQHALYWVHAGRLVHKLDTFTDRQRTARQQVRSLRRLTAMLGTSPLGGLIWQLYADLNRGSGRLKIGRTLNPVVVAPLS